MTDWDWRTKVTTDLHETLIKVARRMYERGLIASLDGNLSARYDDDLLLVTPSGVCKGDLQTHQLVVLDLDGNPVDEEQGKPSSELAMHLEIYRQRPDVKAIVHAHPPTAVALTIARVSLAGGILPEVVATLGHIPTTEYGTPSSQRSADVTRQMVLSHDAMLLARHGAVAVGSDLWDAYYKLETIEHLAKIVLAARQASDGAPVPELPQEENVHFSDKYWVARQKAEGRAEICYGPGRCPFNR